MSRATTYIEQNYPAVRRRSLTTLDGLLKNSVAESFISYISGIKNHRKSLKESEEAIASHFKKMNAIVSMVDDYMTKRLENHENQLLSIAKTQIEAMQQETKQIVEKLNFAITQKNTQDEIWRLSNELDYFKAQTLSIFDQNKKMREEIITLRTSLRGMEVELANNDALMQKLKKKSMRDSSIKDKIICFIKTNIQANKIGDITLQQLNQLLKIDKTQQKAQFKTEITEKSQKKERKCHSRMSLEIYNNSKFETINSLKGIEERMVGRLSVPSSIQNEKGGQSTNIGIQTQVFKSIEQETQRYVTLRHLSQSNDVHLPIQSYSKVTHLKNGFGLRKQLKKMDKTGISIGLTPKFNPKEGRHMRYMSSAFNHNKLSQTKYDFKNKTSTQL